MGDLQDISAEDTKHDVAINLGEIPPAVNTDLKILWLTFGPGAGRGFYSLGERVRRHIVNWCSNRYGRSERQDDGASLEGEHLVTCLVFERG